MPNSNSKGDIKKFWIEGEPFIWISAMGVGIILLIIATMLWVILSNGIETFWPKPLAHIELKNGRQYLGEIKQETLHPHTGKKRIQLKIGNRDLYPLDFIWIDEEKIAKTSYPKEVWTLEREEYGNFYGRLNSYQSPAAPAGGNDPKTLSEILPQLEEQEQLLAQVIDEVKSLSQEMENLRLDILAQEYKSQSSQAESQELVILNQRFERLLSVQGKRQAEVDSHRALFSDIEGKEKNIPLSYIVRSYQPNQMGFFAKLSQYSQRLWELFFAEPRESNTEGGLFPAIIGTVMLILTMSLFSFPMGVVAAVYMKEYAKPGFLLQAIRIAVSNLAGVPSIVWGIFGLTFFIYTLGGGLDQIFFPERLPSPVFGTGGVLWGSLTLALLTVPVVIVATEEALGSVPGDLRHGSYALGATKFQTLVKVTLPMASPRIITGFILAMSRAAGEVAPLMITGVVKLAPSLPIDGSFPFVHLERKFMHLGFHIYDVGFQSPNVEAAKPMVFVTTLLLLAIVILLSSTSIILRNKIRKKYQAKAF